MDVPLNLLEGVRVNAPAAAPGNHASDCGPAEGMTGAGGGWLGDSRLGLASSWQWPGWPPGRAAAHSNCFAQP